MEETTSTKTATLLSKSGPNASGAIWKHYRLDPPMESERYGSDPVTTEYVIVSANDVPYSGPETYIFPADAKGNVIDWLELDGSFKGGLDHDAALAGAGYEVRS